LVLYLYFIFKVEQMTRDEIIEMAIQSSMNYRIFEDEFYSGNTDGVSIEHLEAFTKLVAEKEREACATICEQLPLPEWPNNIRQPLAQAIRAREQA
jgi:hypothetical protein